MLLWSVLLCITLAGCADSTSAAYPLHTAAQSLDLTAVKALVENDKVDVNSKDSTQQTPLHVAVQAFTIYWHPFSQPMYDTIKYLLSKGADPNVPFPEFRDGVKGYTVLHFEAYDGNMALAPLLVASKANVTARDSRDFTPLHSAARCDFRLSCDDCSTKSTTAPSPEGVWKAGALPMIRYLLSQGADVHAKTATGASVLDIVAAVKENCPKTFQYVQAQLATANRTQSG